MRPLGPSSSKLKTLAHREGGFVGPLLLFLGIIIAVVVGYYLLKWIFAMLVAAIPFLITVAVIWVIVVAVTNLGSS